MSKGSHSLIRSSIGRKFFMALTGLFLCSFLIGHLAGNLQLFMEGENGKHQFNDYAYFMTHNPIVKILSYVTYLSVLFHVIDGIVLTVRNRKARPVKYHTSRPGKNSLWSSRNMGVLGTIILVFIIVHMGNFWYVMHWGGLPTYESPNTGHTVNDLHTVVTTFFSADTNNLAVVYVLLYVISMFALGFHLVHGVQSAFQSLGVNHSAYTPIIKVISLIFAIAVPALFASIPVYLFVGGLIV